MTTLCSEPCWEGEGIESDRPTVVARLGAVYIFVVPPPDWAAWRGWQRGLLYLRPLLRRIS
jgi:hypothetical protein